MEKAAAVESFSQLEKISLAGISRIYFGSETCEKKIPSAAEVKQAMAYCKKRSLGFSLMSPFCTDFGIARLKKIFPLLSEEDEIIANDFGVLLSAKKCNAQIVAGRLLNRQSRDPRIASLKGNVPEEMLEHLSLSQASLSEFRKILSSFSVKRVELDNLLHGIGTSISGTGFSASLYFPMVFVSATRLCLSAGAGKIGESKKLGIFPCGQECGQFSFALKNPAFHSRLFIAGNALFFENNSLPNESELEKKGIDRIVENAILLQR